MSRREYPEHPLVGVGVVVLKGGQVLLVQRAREPNKGSWGLPGGLVDLGEKLADAARREVAEECSLEIEVGPVVGAFEPIIYDGEGRVRFHYVVVDFLAEHRGGELQPADDVAQALWVAPDDLDAYNLHVDTQAVIIQALEQYAYSCGL